MLAFGAAIAKLACLVWKFFVPSTDRQLGRAEEANKTQAEVIKDDQVAKTVSDKVDNMSSASADQLQLDLNKRP